MESMTTQDGKALHDAIQASILSNKVLQAFFTMSACPGSGLVPTRKDVDAVLRGIRQSVCTSEAEWHKAIEYARFGGADSWQSPDTTMYHLSLIAFFAKPITPSRHECVCKQAYRHASSLSRHQRGQTGHPTLPGVSCPHHQEGGSEKALIRPSGAGTDLPSHPGLTLRFFALQNSARILGSLLPHVSILNRSHEMLA